METDSNEINMDSADLIPSEWHEKFLTFLKKEKELKIAENKELYGSSESENDDDNDDDTNDDDDEDESDYDDIDDNDDDDTNSYDEYIKKRQAQRDLRKIRVGPLFASQPRLEKICKDEKNKFLSSCFTNYTLQGNENYSVDKIHEKTNDIKYLLNLCGSNLTCLDLSCYPTSQLMPIINANCPNVRELALGFKEITSQDFENCFSNISHLQRLTIDWGCKNSTLPMTLAKSFEQISGTLIVLELLCGFLKNDIFSLDSLAPVFPRLILLKDLRIREFGLSQLLLQSISEIKKLNDLQLVSHWPKNHPMFDTRINMYPIGNLKNLWFLWIDCDYGVTDELLINICNNNRKLTSLHITGTNITDIGMSAINNLKQLRFLNLSSTSGLHFPRSAKNEFITDESIQCLFNQELGTLNISNCINITDKSVLKLVENLPNLRSLYIKNTKITREAVEKIYELRKQRNEPIQVHHSVQNNY